jgi:nucleoside-diphosphate-sugar epimerase
MNENDEAVSVTPYGISKLTQTKFAKFYNQNMNLPIVTLRLFSIFGPFEEPGRLIFDIMTSIIKGKTIELSSPFPRRDYVYVNDVIQAIETIINAKNVVGEIFNIGTGVMHSVQDVVNNVLEIAKSDNKISWGIKQKRVFDNTTPWVSDTEKTKKILKWKPKYSFMEGLSHTYKWYLNNRQIWDKE